MDETLAMQEVQGKLVGLVSQFCWRFPGLDREELLGESQIIALKAIRTYQPMKQTTLLNWVWVCVWRFLNMSCRSKTWRQRVSTKPMVGISEVPEKSHFSLKELLSEVSDIAGEVITLALDRELKKTNLIKALRQEFGFEKDLIQRVFEEVREALP